MKIQVMLDLETLGTRPGSAILSIGAVKFDDETILAEYYQRIDLQSCVDRGLTIDPATVLWWLKQGDTARLELTRPGDNLAAVLSNFTAWIGLENTKDAEVWGNGAAFDNALLAAAYHAADYEMPWRYRNDRCYRTVAAMHPSIPYERTGTYHHALDDARAQALHLIQMLRPKG